MTRHNKTSDILANLGASIARRRGELSLSQEELATKSGVHRTYISDVERGVRNISVLTLERIANALDIRVGALFVWFVSPNGESAPPRDNSGAVINS
jgi:transcriptional regulator with XRE-family HTH domain